MSANLTQHDTNLANSFYLELKTGKVEFQFPPKIVSDGRKGNWREFPTRSYEPYAVYTVAGPRVIVIHATWIVEAGSSWSASKIAKQLVNLRAYFMIGWGKDEDLIAKFRCWQIGGTEEQSCRLTDVNIKYSETLVSTGVKTPAPSSMKGIAGSIANSIAKAASTSASNNTTFPLKTDVTIELRLWSQAGRGDKAIQMVDTKLDTTVFPDWY